MEDNKGTLDCDYSLKNSSEKVWVLIESGHTYSGDPEVVGVFASENAMVCGFAKHVEEWVSEDTIPIAIATLLGKGEKSDDGCVINGRKFIVWQTNVQVLALKGLTKRNGDES